MTGLRQVCQGRSPVSSPSRSIRAGARRRDRVTNTLLATVAAMACVVLVLGRAHSETCPAIPRIENVVPADRAPTKGSTFALHTDLPSAPPAVRIYRVQACVAKKPILLKLIEALPIEVTPEVKRVLEQIEAAPEPTGEGVSVSVGGWHVQVVRGGAWSCWNNARSEIDKTQVRPPSAESVRAVADAFLACTGLMPGRARFSGVEATHRRNGTPIGWSAAYTGDIDGIPLQAGVRVDVGPDLQVLSARSTFRELAPSRMVPILSSQEAFDLLCKGEGSFYGTTVAPGRRCVEAVRLMYWHPPLGPVFDYAVPIYVFTFEGTEPWEPGAAFVEATRPEYLEERQARQQ
jgi:hypothetical protein